MKLARLLQRWAWRGGLAALAGICIEDIAAEVFGRLPNLSTDTHIDLVSLAFAALLWGGLSEFKTKMIVPLRQAMEYGWRWRGEVEEQRRREEEEARIVRLPVVLNATSGGYPIVAPRVPRGRTTGNHRRDRPTPNRYR